MAFIPKKKVNTPEQCFYTYKIRIVKGVKRERRKDDHLQKC